MFANKEYRNSFFKLLKFARFLASGPSYDRLRKKLNHVYVWRIYHLGVCACLCYSYHLSFVLPITPRFPHSDYLLDTISAFIIRLTFLITVLGLIFTSTRKWKEILTYIVEIQEELTMYYPLCKPLKNRTFILRYVNRFLLFFLIMIAEAIFPREEYWRWFVLRGIALLTANVLMVIIDDVAAIIDVDFHLINQVLHKSYLREVRTNAWDVRIKQTETTTRININKVIKIYIKLYKTIDLFNELFGWEIVLMNILAVISSLPTLERIVSWQLDDKAIVRDTFYSLWKITLSMIITKTCHHAAKKGEQFGALIFKISNKLPHSSDYEPIRGDMKFLREMYDEFRPEFSAAGVFTVNYSVYYAIFTLVMSYLAILMQFKYAN